MASGHESDPESAELVCGDTEEAHLEVRDDVVSARVQAKLPGLGDRPLTKDDVIEFYEDYAVPRLVEWLRQRGFHNIAEDVAAHTGVVLWEHIHDLPLLREVATVAQLLDRAKDILAWLRCVAKNRALDMRRGEKTAKRHRARLHQHTTKTVPSPATIASAADDVRQLRRALGLLPESMRTILELRFLQEKSYEEIASCLGVSCDNARLRVHRAMNVLRQMLNKPSAGNTEEV